MHFHPSSKRVSGLGMSLARRRTREPDASGEGESATATSPPRRRTRWRCSFPRGGPRLAAGPRKRPTLSTPLARTFAAVSSSGVATSAGCDGGLGRSERAAPGRRQQPRAHTRATTTSPRPRGAQVRRSSAHRTTSTTTMTRRRETRSAKTLSQGDRTAVEISRTNAMIPTAPAPPSSYAYTATAIADARLARFEAAHARMTLSRSRFRPTRRTGRPFLEVCRQGHPASIAGLARAHTDGGKIPVRVAVV